MVTADGDKIVWILGAGFSRFLGAPLLGDLFTGESVAKINTIYGYLLPWETAKGIDGANNVATLYWEGCKDKQWENAEQFLERLGDAVENETTRSILVAWLMRALARGFHVQPHQLERLRNDAARLLAAECCLFLKATNPGSERWSPYKAWADELQATDTVITFNYDRVVEHAASGREQSLVIPTPNETESADRGPLLLKMHGSVDWLLNGDTIDRADDSTKGSIEEAALHCEAKRIAMGIPGPAKYQLTNGKDGKSGPLTAIWDKAANEIHYAAAVVIVGYRMPETDSFSKRWLLKALQARAQEHHAFFKGADGTLRDFPVHTVLGANLEHEPAQRVAHLLKEVRHVHHVSWPRGAEDFLGVITDRRMLAERRN